MPRRPPWPALVRACERRDADHALSLLAAGAESDKRDPSGRTALWWAARYGLESVVAALLTAGADPTADSQRSGTPLAVAAAMGYRRVMERLLASQRWEATNTGGPRDWHLLRALNDAIRNRRLGVLRLLLDRYPHMARFQVVYWADWEPPLHVAARTGDVRIGTLLVDRGADPRLRTRGLRSALSEAVATGHPAFVAFLASHEVTPTLEDAVALGDVESARSLIAAGADPDARDETGRTLLTWVAGSGSGAMLDVLLDAGADPNARTKAGETSVMFAAARGRREIITQLVRRGADLTEATEFEPQSALSFAARHGQRGTVTWMLSGGAAWRLEQLDVALLACAAHSGDVGIARMLLDAGANVDARNTGTFHRTPLAWAALRGHHALLELLIDRGADVHAPQGRPGTSAATLALEMGSRRSLRMLLQAGADPNVGGLALRNALAGGHRESVRIVLEAGADPDDSAFDGTVTPLMRAAEAGRDGDVTFLLEHGADPARTDANGRTAADRAEDRGHEAIAALVRVAPARRRPA